MLRLPVRDTSGAFRAYRIAALRKMDLANIRATGYSYLEEILWRLHRAGATFTEVPITFHERRAGTSKVNVREAIGKTKHARPASRIAQLACCSLVLTQSVGTSWPASRGLTRPASTVKSQSVIEHPNIS